MQQELFPLTSPCIGICESNNRGYCKGCLRNRNERLYWLQLDNSQKRQVMRRCFLRRAKLKRLANEQQSIGTHSPRQMDFEF